MNKKLLDLISLREPNHLQVFPVNLLLFQNSDTVKDIKTVASEQLIS